VVAGVYDVAAWLYTCFSEKKKYFADKCIGDSAENRCIVGDCKIDDE
jgi:hypothetical protein